ncbi:MAG: hypothetical protein L0206_22445, partial [Actinobacteria bacterium]|nr:hypothetical protein [Actinomycetota bacterium]
MRRVLPFLAILAVPGVARATVPEFDSWNEGIYVFDGADVCSSLSVDEDDKATCDVIRDLFGGNGGNASDILNFAYQAYLSDRLGGDLVDTLIIMSDFDQQLGDALAFYSPLCNSIGGTGRGGIPLCGAQQMSGIIDMNSSDKFPPDYTAGGFFDTLGQEVEHQLAAFLRLPDADLLGRSGSHWSFFLHTEGSVMEGNKWRDEGNGTFTSVDPDGGFHAIDQYLWGFLPPEEVPPLFVIEPAPWFGPEDGDYPINPPTLRGIDAPACSFDSECPPDG